MTIRVVVDMSWLTAALWGAILLELAVAASWFWRRDVARRRRGE